MLQLLRRLRDKRGKELLEEAKKFNGLTASQPVFFFHIVSYLSIPLCRIQLGSVFHTKKDPL